MLLLDVIIEYASNKVNRPFSYAYNGESKIKVGVRVVVNFANRNIVGYVVNVKETSLTIEEYISQTGVKLKEIVSLIDKEPILTSELMSLASDIASYYIAPYINVLSSMLPPSLKPSLSSLNKPRIAYETYVEVVDTSKDNLTPKQQELLIELSSIKGDILKKDIKSTLVPKLVEKGKVKLVKKEKIRLVQEEVKKTLDKELTFEQLNAYNEILNSDDKIFLLEGVTGSGKTEVYLELAKTMLKSGKQVLMLVPEISLTFQMVKRFKEKFDNVAILHSELTPGEKYDEYRRIKNHDVNIVIGARSAIFAPLDDLGLIIIDEEHVETYKQETSPFYHALEVAKMRQKYHPSCKIILGSATPSLETKIRALKGVYHQLYLTKRFNSLPLPKTSIVDMLDYRNIDKESVIFSLKLREEISSTLKNNKQVMLLINKRGFSSFVTCRKCGRTLKCPTCGIPLSYHAKINMLKCHHCGLVENMLSSCPHCKANTFSKVGFGSERVEEEVKRLFPEARTLRLDSDVANIKSNVKNIIDQFESHEADILIGTQMIAKGHDFKDVTLVGVVLADLGLNIPSYKSAERTFNLITQALGRAGRHEGNAKAIIQTYMPKSYVIYDASIQDYNRFFNEEMRIRKLNQNPPYTYLTLVTLQGKNEKEVIDSSFEVKNFLEAKFSSKKVDVIGPSEPFIVLNDGKYNRKLLLKYKSYDDVKYVLKELVENINKNNRIDVIINVDPYEDY